MSPNGTVGDLATSPDDVRFREDDRKQSAGELPGVAMAAAAISASLAGCSNIAIPTWIVVLQPGSGMRSGAALYRPFSSTSGVFGFRFTASPSSPPRLRLRAAKTGGSQEPPSSASVATITAVAILVTPLLAFDDALGRSVMFPWLSIRERTSERHEANNSDFIPRGSTRRFLQLNGRSSPLRGISDRRRRAALAGDA